MEHGKRVVALVGGMLLKNEQTGKFRTSTLVDYDNPFGMFGDSLRGFAATLLYKREQEHATILVLGGLTPLHKEMPHAPLLSAIIRRELEEWGVPASKIEEIEMQEVGGTFQQLLHLQEKLPAFKKTTKELVVITNRYQMPRVWAMIYFREELAELRNCVAPLARFASAEDIVLEYLPEYGPDIVKAYRREAMRKCIARESKGAHQIAEGTYVFPSKFPQR